MNRRCGTLLTVREQALAARAKKEGTEFAGLSAAEQQAFIQPILDKYEVESSAYYSTVRIWDDGIIEPASTREVVGLGLAAACNVPIDRTTFGVFRM